VNRRTVAATMAALCALLLCAAPPLAPAATGAGRHAGTGPITYLGGRVLHATRTHAIFWQPAGSGLAFPAGYRGLVVRFLRDVAAASHTTSNLFGITGQYPDSGGPAAYASRFAGAVLDTDRLPPSRCHEPASTGPGWTICLTDAQLQRELARLAQAHALAVGGDNVYFLVTPLGLGSCTNAGSTSCALGGRDTGFCGYHSVASGGLLYAVIPYNAVPGHCQSQNPRPNANPADPALSTVAHELAETATDPYGDGWAAANGDEIADVCIGDDGRPLGGDGEDRWNEEIDGDRYWLQELYSRIQRECEPRPQPDTATIGVPPDAAAGHQVRLVARARQPGGFIVSYAWQFGDGGAGTGAQVEHAWAARGVYRVALKVVDAAGNWAYADALVRVTNSGGAIAR
jgi:hypothetical protein